MSNLFLGSNVPFDYLSEFKKLNKTTKSIYDLEDNKVLIILNDGTNLTNWNKVKNKQDIVYISENLSNKRKISKRYANLTNLRGIVALGFTNRFTNISGMFEGCENLVEISSLAEWDVSNVENAEYMFSNCRLINDFSPLDNWPKKLKEEIMKDIDESFSAYPNSKTPHLRAGQLDSKPNMLNSFQFI